MTARLAAEPWLARLCVVRHVFSDRLRPTVPELVCAS